MSKQEVSKELDKYFYKDIRNIIEDFLFVNCKDCDEAIREEHSLDSVDNKFYCLDCVLKPNILDCNQCEKFYNILDGDYLRCAICCSCCRLYCRKCFMGKTITLNDIEKDLPHLSLINQYIDDVIGFSFILG